MQPSGMPPADAVWDALPIVSSASTFAVPDDAAREADAKAFVEADEIAFWFEGARSPSATARRRSAGATRSAAPRRPTSGPAPRATSRRSRPPTTATRCAWREKTKGTAGHTRQIRVASESAFEREADAEAHRLQCRLLAIRRHWQVID